MKYSAYYVEEKDGIFSASISELELEKPAEGSVQIKVSHSSLNYKDALSASCLLYTSPSPRDRTSSRMPSSA